MEKFLIIDGNSLAYRAFYALPFLTSTKGEPTGAIFGFMNMFTKVLDEYRPTHVAVAFDFSRKTFRNRIFPEYKGTRRETPPELRSQFPILKDFLMAMGVKVVEQKCIEADDIIGTLAKSTDCDTVILSGDKDVLQLIDSSTQVWLTKKGISEIYKVNEQVLLNDFRLTPSQITDLKALMGDSSDNIPGVKGIGPKTATNLIEQFGTIENLYQNLDNPNISNGVKLKLETYKDTAFMSKILATIKQDCEVDVDFNSYRLSLPFSAKSTDLIRRYDMTTLLKKTGFFANSQVNEEIKIEQIPLEKKEISTLEEIRKICGKELSNEFAFFIDNDVSFSFNKQNYYVITSEFTLFFQPPELKDTLQALAHILQNESIKKVVSDYKKTRHMLSIFGIELKGEIFDLKLANYLLGGRVFDEKNVGNYFNLKNAYKSALEIDNLTSLYYEMELPLEDVLYDMEVAGFKIDAKELAEISKILDIKLKHLTEKIYLLSGEPFNINSPKQLAEVLFGKLKLPIGDNKKLSTGVDVLTNLIGTHDIIPEILKYRKVQKLKTTYVDSFQTIINKSGDIIHTIFNQTLTATGRLSSSEPNLQNLPIREEEGRELRKIFISRFVGGQIISSDYNQIELRLLAHCSEDEILIDAFNENKDIHTLTASQIFDVPESHVTKSQRRDAKAVNFGIIYGISDFGLSQNVGISRKSAQEYINKYFETYPKVKLYMDANIEFAKKMGYAKTIFNRRRKIPEINAQNYVTRQFGARVAMNMPLQGSASDIIKFAMLKVYKEIKRQNLESKLILQIHDELIIDSPASEVEIVKKILKNSMENVVKLKVPLPVEVESGNTFFDV